MHRMALMAMVLSIAAPSLAGAQNCTYTLSTLAMTVPGEGGTGQVTVTTGSGCPWTAVSDRSWLTVLTPSGTGSGSVTWSVVPNPNQYQRIGYLTIAGISIFVSQTVAPPGSPPPPPPPPPGTPTAPGAPRQFAVTVNGSGLTLTWNAPDSGGTPTTYVLAAGSAAGWSNLGSFPTGNTQTSWSTSYVPNGTYFARVSAQNTSGIGPASNEVSFTVPQACQGTPDAPSSLQSSVSGLAVTLTWAAPSSGTPPTAYVIEAGTAAGLANVAVVNTGSAGTVFTAIAVPGTYFVRVRAAAACGTGPASGDVAVVVR